VREAEEARGFAMKIYLISLGAGVLVGVIYSLLNVRSPAPPLVALIGLLGMLAGEQIIPVARQMMAGEGLAAAGRPSARLTCSACCRGDRPTRPSQT
jgi:XapX domain-containing protein